MKGQRVSETEEIYRRAFGPPDKRFLNPDGSATSRVFKLRPKDNGQLSVDVKSLTTAEFSVIDPTKFVLFEINNKDVIDLGLETIHDPLTLIEHGIDNHAHALVLGIDKEDDIIPGLLAKKSTRVIIPWQAF